jgi:hypothetical protein
MKTTNPHPGIWQELAEVVAANTPVFYLHPRERFFPCTVEWFLQHARLAVMRNVLLRRKVERGELPAATRLPHQALYCRVGQGRCLCARSTSHTNSASMQTACGSSLCTVHDVGGWPVRCTLATSFQLILYQSCAVLVPYGELDAASLRQAYEANPKQRMQIQLRQQARPGQREALDHIPVYAHVRVGTATAARAALCCTHDLLEAPCTMGLRAQYKIYDEHSAALPVAGNS